MASPAHLQLQRRGGQRRQAAGVQYALYVPPERAARRAQHTACTAATCAFPCASPFASLRHVLLPPLDPQAASSVGQRVDTLSHICDLCCSAEQWKKRQPHALIAAVSADADRALVAGRASASEAARCVAASHSVVHCSEYRRYAAATSAAVCSPVRLPEQQRVCSACPTPWTFVIAPLALVHSPPNLMTSRSGNGRLISKKWWSPQ